MIDSVTLRYTINSKDARIFILNAAISLPEQVTEEIREDFLDPDKFNVTYLYKYSREALNTINPGLISLQLYKSRHQYDTYYISISFCLESIISHTRNNNRLFVATYDNIIVLQEAYTSMISELLPVIGEYIVPIQYDFDTNMLQIDPYGDSEVSNLCLLPYLACATVTRIDHAVNFYVEDKPTFLRLVRKSFIPKKCHIYEKFDDNENVVFTTSRKMTSEEYKALLQENKQSTGKIQISATAAHTTITLYDKAQKYLAKGCDDQSFIEEAEYIVRFECSLRHINKNKERASKILHINYSNPLGLLPWLDEQISFELLQSYYETNIGSQDFYNDYRFEKLVRNHDYGYSNVKSEENRKDELMDLSYLISRAHSVDLALTQYVNGTNIGKDSRELKGTKEKFFKLCDQIKEAGVMPMRLPEYGSTKGMKVYHNPWVQYVSGNDILKGYQYYRDNPDEFVAISTGLFANIKDLTNKCDMFIINAVNKGWLDRSNIDTIKARYKQIYEDHIKFEKEHQSMLELNQKMLDEIDRLEQLSAKRAKN